MNIFIITVEGLPQRELSARLQSARIQLNDYARTLLHPQFFDFSKIGTYRLQLATVADLGFNQPATLPAIYRRIEEKGFRLCPLELGPYLRLAWQNQPVSSNVVLTGQHKSPESAVNIATPVLSSNHQVPKGFYLRNVNGTLWLRGYICDAEHKNALDTIFAFIAD